MDRPSYERKARDFKDKEKAMPDNQNEIIRLRKQAINKDFARMNPMQMQAVTRINGPVLILAGAGSGKTTVLVNRIANMVKYGDAYLSDPEDAPSAAEMAEAKAYLASPKGTPPDILRVSPVRPWNILAITFTNKAAGELCERIEKRLGPAARDIWAGTFHSTCAKMLRRYGDRLGYTSHFTIYDTDDQKRVMKEVYKQLELDERTLPVKTVLGGISRAKDQLISPEEAAGATGDFLNKQIARAYALYQKLLLAADAMDFDDLLWNAVRLLRENADVLDYYSNTFRYIMVDEYQDTNHAQYVFVKLLAARHRNICVVGDDDQSIYRFRGATIENILNFEKEYREAAVIRLEQNYRSTGNILNAANEVIKGNTARKGKTLWTENGEGEKILLYTAPDEQSEARFIADTILDNLRKGERFADHAVLYRTNAQSNALENVFARSGISYKVIGGTRFYDRKEIRDVMAYLQVVNNPADAVRLRRIINEPKRGIGDATIAALGEIADGLGITMLEVAAHAGDYPALSRSAAKLRDFAAMIEDIRIFAETAPLHAILEYTLDQSGYMAALQAAVGGKDEKAADRVDNVNELSSNLLLYEEENDEPTLGGFLEEVALISDIDAMDPDADYCVMMTLHSAKGLEFDNVFISGMEEGLFPGNQSIYGGPEEIEEERRLAYVGITRAKKRLVLTNTVARMLYGSTTRNRPSRFLGEIPEELLERRGAAFVQDYAEGRFKGRTAALYGGETRFSDFGERPRAARVGAFAPTGAYPRENRRGKSALLNDGGTAASAAPPAGTRVRHKAFGEGVVLQTTPMGNDTLIEICFETVGTKKLMSNFARLDVVEQDNSDEN